MSKINLMEIDIIPIYTKNLLLYESHWDALGHLIGTLIKEGIINTAGYNLIENLIDLFSFLNEKIGVDHYSSFDVVDNIDTINLTFNSSIEETNNGNCSIRKILKIKLKGE